MSVSLTRDCESLSATYSICFLLLFANENKCGERKAQIKDSFALEVNESGYFTGWEPDPKWNWLPELILTPEGTCYRR